LTRIWLRIRSCPASTSPEHALDSSVGRIFCGKPVATFPDNAFVAAATCHRPRALRRNFNHFNLLPNISTLRKQASWVGEAAARA
jgi:hypothetical protein